MNCWRFGPDIFAACRDVPLSPRGEYELPLAVKLRSSAGMKLKIAISQAACSISRAARDIAAVTERFKNVQVEL